MAGQLVNFTSCAMDEDLQSPYFEFMTTTTGSEATHPLIGLRRLGNNMTSTHTFLTLTLNQRFTLKILIML